MRPRQLLNEKQIKFLENKVSKLRLFTDQGQRDGEVTVPGWWLTELVAFSLVK